MGREPYEGMLAESIQMVLSQLKSGNTELQHFELMFSRLIQTMDSPPIEVIWFYSALKFQTHIDSNIIMSRIYILNTLFHSLISFTSTTNRVTKVAALAPLTFELYSFILDFKNDTCTDTDADAAIVVEIGRLIDRLVSFISLCCCDTNEGTDHDDDTHVFSPCFIDLVKLWTFRYDYDFNMFFPLITPELRNVFFAAPTVGVLAGFVMCQAFLLNLCLHYSDVHVRVVDLAVTTITGFRSCYFFDTLLKTLLGTCLAVTPLLTVFDELLLRESVFDAIILVDYPFFDPGCGIHLCSRHLNSLASTWLFVADKAMQFARRKGEQTKIIAYTNAFSKSLIRYQLLKWASTQIAVAEDANKTNLSTPAAFMEWLVQLSNQASRGFDDGEFSMLVGKASSYMSEMKTALPHMEIDDNNQIVGEDGRADEDLEMIDTTSAGCNSNFLAIDVHTCQKRKKDENEGSMRVKLLKYHIHDSPSVKNFIPFKNEASLIRRSSG